MNDLPHLQDLAHEGRTTDPARLRPVHGQGGIEHGAGPLMPAAQASAAGDGSRAQGVVPEARQGHLYSWRGNDVIAMEGGPLPRVSYIDPAWSWCSPPFHVDAADLVAQPMKYFGNEVPR